MTLRFFSSTQVRFFRAFLEAVVPGAGEHVIEAADRMIASKPASIQRKMKLFMMIARILPLFRYLRTFPSLSVEQRRRYLSWLSNGPIRLFRLGAWGLRNIALLSYYGDEASWERLEYGGPVVKDRPRRLDQPADPFESPGGRA